MAETHEGNILALRRRFKTSEAAEDHPVTMKLWKRVWVEEEDAPALSEPVLPPGPYDWIKAAGASNNGAFHAYLIDANGRKIAAIWGRGAEKELLADFMLDRMNLPEAGHALPARLADPLRDCAKEANIPEATIVAEAVAAYLGFST